MFLLDAGWTVQQIADAIGADNRSVYRWASGDSRPMVIAHNRGLALLRAGGHKLALAG